MNSIYVKASNDQIIARIELLTVNSQAIWGKMTVDQMLKHTNEAILIAFAERTLKISFVVRIIGRMMKNKIFSAEFKKNSPTAPEFIFKKRFDFEDSKNELTTNFSRFAQGHDAIKVIDHPFWGKMTYEDWDKLMWKHVDHH
jgi:hypothetical protein